MDTTAAETTTIEREIAIAAPPETVWSFLVDPSKAARWMGIALELDARPGGLYRAVAAAGDDPGPDPWLA